LFLLKMAKPFKDLGKDAKDLLSQDLPDGNGVTITNQLKTSNDINVKTTMKRTFKRENKGLREIIEAIVEPKYEWKQQNIEFNSKFSTARDFSGSVALKDMITKGSKVEFIGTHNEKDGLVVKTVDSYKNEYVFVQGSISYPTQHQTKTPIKYAGEIVVQYPKNFLWGFNFMADQEKNKTKKNLEATVGYAEKEWQLFARTSKNLSEDQSFWGGSFIHNLSENSKWGLDFDAEASHSWHRGPIVKVGGEYKHEGTTFKARTLFRWPAVSMSNPEYRLALSAKRQISKHFTATIGADINIRQFLGDTVGDVHSVGLDFKIEK